MIMTDTTVTTDATYFDRTVADLKQGVQTASTAQTQASEKAMQTAKDVAAFNQGTVQAFAQASQIMAAGVQDLFGQMVSSGQTAVTESLNSMRAFASAKTVKERIELQANFVRTSAVWSVSESSRFAHAGIELAEKVSAPLVARATLAAETMSNFKG